ncbi:uncharacterized protein EDB91DRAFT_1141106 [Suillus paluster]|uniref:uncharacterized protein n=1 Tax=Suillus paluster TaxID=48578 RepID=UPI001B87F2F5|nr:uncharacterized protein EDB91DRAFT_1141106 [Suillus paluster]KAG1737111.1 hypothetical protein EDB91DRAFT_1141106 [Suillus paluster]
MGYRKFANSNTATVACNLAPQYVLEHTTKPIALSPGSVAKPKKTRVVPDFAQVLQYVQTSSNGSHIRDIQKVVLLVENKPKIRRKELLDGESPFDDSSDQVRKQAAYAFVADPSLRAIGTILAFGARWKYVEIDRPQNTVLNTWVETGDKMYGRRKQPLIEVVPEELRRLSVLKDNFFELLDPEGLSARAFEIIARRIKIREREIWNL